MKILKVCAELVVLNLFAALGAIGGVALVFFGHRNVNYGHVPTANELQMTPSEIKFSVVCVALLLSFSKAFNTLRRGLRRWINRLW